MESKAENVGDEGNHGERKRPRECAGNCCSSLRNRHTRTLYPHSSFHSPLETGHNHLTVGHSLRHLLLQVDHSCCQTAVHSHPLLIVVRSRRRCHHHHLTAGHSHPLTAGRMRICHCSWRRPEEKEHCKREDLNFNSEHVLCEAIWIPELTGRHQTHHWTHNNDNRSTAAITVSCQLNKDKKCKP